MQQYLFFTGIFSRRELESISGRGQKFLDNLKKLYGKEILWKIDPSLAPRRYNIIGVGSEEIREKMEKVI